MLFCCSSWKPGRLKSAEEEEERKFTARYVRTSWARTWCTMLGKNIFACLQDTAAGVDAKPRRAAAARTGPHPALDPGDDADGQEEFEPRRLGSNTVGTVNTPLAVVSPLSEVSGQAESMWGANSASATPGWREGSQYTTAADHGGNAAEGANGKLDHYSPRVDSEEKNPGHDVGPAGSGGGIVPC